MRTKKIIVKGKEITIKAKVIGEAQGTPFPINLSHQFNMEITYIKDRCYRNRKTGFLKTIIDYYEADMVIREFDGNHVARSFRFPIRMNNALFQQWHKGTGPDAELKEFIIDIWLDT